jgi:hypothetical protein
MIKLFYVLVVVISLLPSVLAGIATIYVAREVRRIRLEEQQHSPDKIYVRTHSYALLLGTAEVTIYPRLWAAVLILVGVVFWLVGVIFVLFLRQP